MKKAAEKAAHANGPLRYGGSLASFMQQRDPFLTETVMAFISGIQRNAAHYRDCN
jgi:hypothetical protein